MTLFNLKNKVVIITGGSGALGSNMAKYLLTQGAKVVILGQTPQKVEQKIEKLKEVGDDILGFTGSVLEKAFLQSVKTDVINRWGSIDVLINAAGGNMPGATIGENQTIFDLKMEDFRKVSALNLDGTVLPSIIFGEVMANQGTGSIINVSSMAAQNIITRIAGYSASKAAIDNFTKWMSVELALKFGEGLRVNAIAPGFFIGSQNRRLLTNEDGSYTDRGNTIIKNTPMNRFGEPEELNGAIHYLASEASKFVTGTILAIDGGFSAFSGV